MAKKCDSKQMVGIGASLAAFIMVMWIVTLAMAPTMVANLVPVTIALAVLGIFLGYFASKKK